MLQELPHTTWNTPRSVGVAGILWLCFGTIGLHRAYLNRKHWLTMFLAGGFGWFASPVGVWPPQAGGFGGFILLVPVGLLWLADLFRIAGWVADHNAVVGRD